MHKYMYYHLWLQARNAQATALQEKDPEIDRLGREPRVRNKTAVIREGEGRRALLSTLLLEAGR